MKEDRPGTLVCVCGADGRILLNAPYDSEDCRIEQSRRRRGITSAGRASNSGEGSEEHAESRNV